MAGASGNDDARVGFDPNGTTWLVFRYASDYAPPAGSGRTPPALDGVYFDPLREQLALTPLAAAPEDNAWLPLAPVVDARGDAYRSDPDADRILRRRACDSAWVPLPCFGGHGPEPGHLARPLGLALDREGLLYVADSGNHRVQVIRPEDGSVVSVLGRVDAWGRPLAGVTGGAMSEPVDVAIDPRTGRLFVADRAGGRVHVFDRRQRWQRSIVPRTDVIRPGFTPHPLAVVVAADGSVLIADASWPRLLHAAADGQVLPEVALETVDDPHLAGLALRVRYPGSGEAIIGPLDGQSHDVEWHRVLVEADLPAGTSIEVQSFAANDASVAAADIPWAPGRPVAIPQAGEAPEDGVYQRLVLSDVQRWQREVHGAYRRGRPRLAGFPFGADGVAVPGPAAGAARQVLPEAALRVVRAGDTVELGAGTRRERVRLTGLLPVTVELFADGQAALYRAGSTLTLLERAEQPLPGAPRRLYTLAAGELVDLETADTTGGFSEQDFPHGAAALFRPGDRWRLADATKAIELTISSLGFTRTAVTLAGRGDAVVYGAGAELYFLGGTGGPRLLRTLREGETVDLGGAAGASITSAALPIAVVRLLGPGGDYRLVQPGAQIDVHVAALTRAQPSVGLDPPPAGDFSRGELRLVETPGRLVADDLAGFETPTSPGERITLVAGARSVRVPVRLAEPDTGVVWIDPAALTPEVGFATWESFTTDASVATDRGRYLWLRVRLEGRLVHPADLRAVETPALRALRISFRRPSYLRLLPAVFSQRDPLNDASGALFLERFLTLFEGRLTAAEQRYEDFARDLDPRVAPAEWLAWLGSWLDLVFDPSWSEAKRRQLVAEAAQLYHQRGTLAGLRRWIEIYTGRAPEIVEAFRTRRTAGLVLGLDARLGCGQLSSEAARAASCDGSAPDRFAHRFSVYVYLGDACEREVTESVVRALLEALKPAHTQYQLITVLPGARVGVQATIGYDFVLGDRAPRESVLGLTDEPEGKRMRPIIGRDLVLARDRAAAAHLARRTP